MFLGRTYSFKDFKFIKVISSMDRLCLLFWRNQHVSYFRSIFPESGKKREAALPSSILILELQKRGTEKSVHYLYIIVPVH